MLSLHQCNENVVLIFGHFFYRTSNSVMLETGVRMWRTNLTGRRCLIVKCELSLVVDDDSDSGVSFQMKSFIPKSCMFTLNLTLWTGRQRKPFRTWKTRTVYWLYSRCDLSHFFHLIMRTQTLQLNEYCLFVIGHVSTISLLLCWPDWPILLYPMSLYHLHDHTKIFSS